MGTTGQPVGQVTPSQKHRTRLRQRPRPTGVGVAKIRRQQRAVVLLDDAAGLQPPHG